MRRKRKCGQKTEGEIVIVGLACVFRLLFGEALSRRVRPPEKSRRARGELLLPRVKTVPSGSAGSPQGPGGERKKGSGESGLIGERDLSGRSSRGSSSCQVKALYRRKSPEGKHRGGGEKTTVISGSTRTENKEVRENEEAARGKIARPPAPAFLTIRAS